MYYLQLLLLFLLITIHTPKILLIVITSKYMNNNHIGQCHQRTGKLAGYQKATNRNRCKRDLL